MSDIVMDFERERRCGVSEAVFCERKTAAQISEIVELASAEAAPLLLTRLTEQKWHALTQDTQAALQYDPISNTATFGLQRSIFDTYKIAIVSAGASDNAVCSEIAATLRFHGFQSERFEDVGVSALWRLQARLAEISQCDLIIAVAGMEAALPTVLCGMVPQPIIAVPTSVGYGVAAGGKLALNAMLGSCATGITVVNIDNGFGAACAAIRILNMLQRAQRPLTAMIDGDELSQKQPLPPQAIND